MKILGRWKKNRPTKDVAWAEGKRDFFSGTAVMLVHGFGSSAEKTWLNTLKLFLQDESLGEVTFFAYRYPTKRVAWKPWQRLPDLKMLATGLATETRLRASKYREIVIIAHSMGGLVARRMIVDDLSTNQPPLIKRALLLATPNSGSALGSILSAILPRHQQAASLALLSEELEALNDDWVTNDVEQRVEVKFIAAGFDQIVSPRSVKALPGRPLDGALIEYGHSAITQCDTLEDSNYIFFREFILQGGSMAGLLENQPCANALFEVYRLQHEPFYQKREFDTKMQAALLSGDVWIWGESGVGKTACAMRSVAQNATRTIHIYLGSYAKTDAELLLSALAAEIGDRLGFQPNQATTVGRTISALADHLHSYCLSNEMVALLIEEIPFDDDKQLVIFVEYLRSIRETVEARGSDNLRIVLTSIASPSNLVFPNLKKKISSTSFLELRPWQPADLTGLAKLIEAGLGMKIGGSIPAIINEAEGLPRFVKTVFRGIHRAASDGNPPIEKIIDQVRRERV